MAKKEGMLFSKKFVTFLIFLILLFSLIAVIIHFYQRFEVKVDIIEEKKIPETRQEIIDNCQNISLENTAKCLRDNIATFFYYNASNIGQRFDFYKQSDFERMKKQGGVCRHWADLYLSLARSLNYNTNRVSLNLGQGFTGSHVVFFMNDNNGYCILDMLNYNCFKSKNSTGK